MASNAEYIGAIAIFAGGFSPKNWMLCDGSHLEIKRYSELYSVIETIYGGDGIKDFALPNLKGRVPVNYGGEYLLGQSGGFEAVTLETDQLASHSHIVYCDITSSGSQKIPKGNYFAKSELNERRCYSKEQNYGMANDITTSVGGGKSHTNMQPYLTINFIICVKGEYPPRLDDNKNNLKGE